jgi:hypothetical protein
MTDIVERLREHDHDWAGAQDIKDAIAEIEKLRVLGQQEGEITGKWLDASNAEIAKAAAAAEREAILTMVQRIAPPRAQANGYENGLRDGYTDCCSAIIKAIKARGTQ